VIRKI